MGKTETKALWRLGRCGISLLISAAVSYFADQPAFLALAPVLNGLSKWVRGKFNLPFMPF